MNTMSIKQLIDKYFEGRTSLAEEAILRDYFNNKKVSEELIPYTEIFRYMSDARDQRIESDDFEEKTIKSIRKGSIMRQSSAQFFAAAAAAVVFIVMGVFIFSGSTQQMPDDQLIVKKYSTKDPELAYQQTKEALGLVSEKLNKGMEQMKEISVFYEYQTKLFNKSKVAL